MILGGNTAKRGTIAYLHISWQVALCQCQTSYSSGARSWILCGPRVSADAVAGPPFWLTLQHAEKTKRWRRLPNKHRNEQKKKVYKWKPFHGIDCTITECLTNVYRLLACIQPSDVFIEIHNNMWGVIEQLFFTQRPVSIHFQWALA